MVIGIRGNISQELYKLNCEPDKFTLYDLRNVIEQFTMVLEMQSVAIDNLVEENKKLKKDNERVMNFFFIDAKGEDE